MSKNKTLGVIQLGDAEQIMATLLAFKGFSKDFQEIKKTIILKEKENSLAPLLEEEFQEIIYIKNLNDLSKDENINYLKNLFNNKTFQVLINLTYNKSSGYLCSFLNSPYKLGFKYSKFNSLKIDDSWSRYVYSVIMGKNLNPFSLIDIYKSIIGNKKTVTACYNFPIRKIILNLENVNESLEGMSLLQKKFPSIEIILISKTNQMDIWGSFKVCTSISDFLKENLKNSWYFGNYSVFSLICSYKNVQCINTYSKVEDLFLYPPYGIGNFGKVKPFILEKTLLEIENRKGDNLFETIKGKGYFSHVIQTIETPLTLDKIFLEFYKYIFEFCWENIEESNKINSILENTLIELDKYLPATESLKKIVEIGKKYSVYILQELSTSNPDFKKIKEFGIKIDEIGEHSLKLKRNFPYLAGIIDYFHYSRLIAQGENLHEITQNIFFVFEEYIIFLEIILELINNIKSRFTIIEKGN